MLTYRITNDSIHTMQEIINQIKSRPTPLLVGIDGVDAAGKTHFAKKLAEQVANIPKQNVVLSSIDFFHHPKKTRYQKGKDSPVGFYEDSFNVPLLKQKLLDPFKSGKGLYQIKGFDHKTDSELYVKPLPIPLNPILIMEGIFLFRPELRAYWDLKIFLHIDFQTALERNIKRSLQIDELNTDKINESNPQQAEAIQRITKRYHSRYRPGQELYFQQADPQSKADWLIDNTNYTYPVVIRGM